MIFSAGSFVRCFARIIKQEIEFDKRAAEKEEVRENATVSELIFTPSTDDDGKHVTCRAENPNVTGAYLEDTWKIEVVCKYNACMPFA
ncbi:hypothetical protein J437_LFUL002791 [Ladona fulva]|uniref:Uncharacterized protein n=1 Tax=Ladona fulva TaxID=123851 RepID=A0A8K0JTM1_LADFU|nr:hypothetical protein J437_LFUL002791 [Ladona fulva]